MSSPITGLPYYVNIVVPPYAGQPRRDVKFEFIKTFRTISPSWDTCKMTTHRCSIFIISVRSTRTLSSTSIIDKGLFMAKLARLAGEIWLHNIEIAGQFSL